MHAFRCASVRTACQSTESTEAAVSRAVSEPGVTFSSHVTPNPTPVAVAHASASAGPEQSTMKSSSREDFADSPNSFSLVASKPRALRITNPSDTLHANFLPPVLSVFVVDSSSSTPVIFAKKRTVTSCPPRVLGPETNRCTVAVSGRALAVTRATLSSAELVALKTRGARLSPSNACRNAFRIQTWFPPDSFVSSLA